MSRKTSPVSIKSQCRWWYVPSTDMHIFAKSLRKPSSTVPKARYDAEGHEDDLVTDRRMLLFNENLARMRMLIWMRNARAVQMLYRAGPFAG